ncbi:MAG: flagellar hook-length control protein FliK [Myxococcota bacterium]|nr:flagellar hook-length control protein FliK [Myxococcota bacterium]
MGEGDKYQNESGFIDKADALEESFEDTVHVPSYRSDKEEEAKSPASTSSLNNAVGESQPQETQIHVADLTWDFDDDPYSGDAPLAQALDSEQSAEVSSKRSDFFVRSDHPLEQTKFAQRDVPSFVETHLFDPKTSGMRVSEFAQRAERMKWKNTKTLSQGTTGNKGSTANFKQPLDPDERNTLEEAKREYPLMMSLLQDPSEIQSKGTSNISSSPPVPGTFFPTSSKKELVPESGPPDMEGLLSTMAEGVLVGGSSDGSSHMMITLNDEYFRGTELRISIESNGVKAHLIPPDYEVYRHLSSELPRLEERLLARGLTVNEVSVLKP